jgi:hypothetical protein
MQRFPGLVLIVLNGYSKNNIVILAYMMSFLSAEQ